MNSDAIAPLPSRLSEKATLTLAQLPSSTPIESVIQLACRITAALLRVERVSIWLLTETKETLQCVDLFELSNERHSRGMTRQLQDLPNYLQSLRQRKVIGAENVSEAPWTAELAESHLIPNGITSVLEATIFLEGELHGVVCIEHVGHPREWSTESRDFAGSVADLIAVRIQQNRSACPADAAVGSDPDRSPVADRAAAIEATTSLIDQCVDDLAKSLAEAVADEPLPTDATDVLAACRLIQKAAQEAGKTARELQKQVLEDSQSQNKPDQDTETDR